MGHPVILMSKVPSAFQIRQFIAAILDNQDWHQSFVIEFLCDQIVHRLLISVITHTCIHLQFDPITSLSTHSSSILPGQRTRDAKKHKGQKGSCSNQGVAYSLTSDGKFLACHDVQSKEPLRVSSTHTWLVFIPLELYSFITTMARGRVWHFLRTIHPPFFKSPFIYLMYTLKLREIVANAKSFLFLVSTTSAWTSSAEHATTLCTRVIFP